MKQLNIDNLTFEALAERKAAIHTKIKASEQKLRTHFPMFDSQSEQPSIAVKLFSFIDRMRSTYSLFQNAMFGYRLVSTVIKRIKAR